MQLAFGLATYSYQKYGANSVEYHLEGCHHRDSIFHTCLWSHTHTRVGRLPRYSGKRGSATLSAGAASANLYAKINRPGTLPANERSGTDSGAAAEGPATAASAPRFNSGAARQKSQCLASGSRPKDSFNQRRNASSNPCPAYPPPEGIGKSDAAT